MKVQTCICVLLYVATVLASNVLAAVVVAEEVKNEDVLEVKIAQGIVRGHKHPTEDLYAFYNIPYATAPTGTNKFRPPLPPPEWTETYDAVDKKVVCPQHIPLILKYIPDPVIQEDCLIANVLVPNTDAKNLSVLVYVHGGAFIEGFGNYNKGTQLLKTKDVIMVTFNYRLAIHGFLCLGTEDVPGNAGLKDQIALLRWVKENIASFGGNPDDVTLAGASAGSASVDLLMLSKSAEGLFHRVIPESGGNLAAFAIQRDPTTIAQFYAQHLNDTIDVSDIPTLEEFYKAASIELLTSESLYGRTDTTLLFSPCVERVTEGAVLTESPLSILKKGEYKKLPMLYGFANMEGLINIGLFDSWKDKMNANFSEFLPADLQFDSTDERVEVGNEIKKFYFGDDPVSDNILKFIDYNSDTLFTFAKLWAVKLHTEAGHDQVYLYEYSFVDENDPVVPNTDIRGADHCAQSVAWLDHHSGASEALETPEFQNMRKIIREIWHSFIKTGKPIPEGSSLPAWPAVGKDMSPHMQLDETVALGGELLEERNKFWNDIYEKHYLDSVAPRSGASVVQQSVFSLFVVYAVFYLVK